MYIFHCFSFSDYIRYFIKVVIHVETNVNISNELNFYDVYEV